GGAVTCIGAPKLLQVSSLCVTSLPRVVIVTRRRTRPCWSRYTVPLTFSGPLGKPVLADSGWPAIRAVKAYRVPVQPGPDAGPWSCTWPADRSTPENSAGLTGRSETKLPGLCGGRPAAAGVLSQGRPRAPGPDAGDSDV